MSEPMHHQPHQPNITQLNALLAGQDGVPVGTALHPNEAEMEAKRAELERLVAEKGRTLQQLKAAPDTHSVRDGVVQGTIASGIALWVTRAAGNAEHMFQNLMKSVGNVDFANQETAAKLDDVVKKAFKGLDDTQIAAVKETIKQYSEGVKGAAESIAKDIATCNFGTEAINNSIQEHVKTAVQEQLKKGEFDPQKVELGKEFLGKLAEAGHADATEAWAKQYVADLSKQLHEAQNGSKMGEIKEAIVQKIDKQWLGKQMRGASDFIDGMNGYQKAGAIAALLVASIGIKYVLDTPKRDAKNNIVSHVRDLDKRIAREQQNAAEVSL
jgi:hypothetical protein